MVFMLFSCVRVDQGWGKERLFKNPEFSRDNGSNFSAPEIYQDVEQRKQLIEKLLLQKPDFCQNGFVFSHLA